MNIDIIPIGMNGYVIIVELFFFCCLRCLENVMTVCGLGAVSTFLINRFSEVNINFFQIIYCFEVIFDGRRHDGSLKHCF